MGFETENLTRRAMLLRAGTASAVLTLPGLLAACGSGDSGGSADGATASGSVGGKSSTARVQHVTWGTSGQTPVGLDVATNFGGSAITAMSLGLEGLLANDNELTLQPALATAWSQPDELHYEFELRQGVKFWDGTPLTIDDVVFSLRRHIDRDVASQIGTFWVNVKSIDAVGADKVTLTLSRPDETVPHILPFSYIIPKAQAERLGKKLGAPGSSVNIMGTGAYEITSFTTEDGIRLKRNPNYWGDAPRVQAATLKWFPDPQTMLLAARAGSVDGVFGIEGGGAKNWERVPGWSTEFVTGMNVAFLSFDVEAEPWNDVHVRRAVAHCADTAGYVRAFTGGKGTPATTMVSPPMWAGVATEAEVEALYKTVPQYPYDVAKAKAELAKSAHPDGFSASIDVPENYPAMERALVSLSQTLKQIGIRLTVKSVPTTEWVAKLYGHKDLGMFLVILGPSYADPANYLLLTYLSKNAVPNNFNLANFRDPKVDRLLNEQNAEQDKAKRTQMIGEVMRISGEQLPYLPLWWYGTGVAVSGDLSYDGYNELYYQQDWLTNVGTRA